MKHVTLLLLALVAACARQSTAPASPSGLASPQSSEPAAPKTPVTVEDEATVALLPPPPVVQPPERPRRRLTVDQLDAAIRQVTGGIGWTETQSGKEVDLFEQLGATLGRPDYIEQTAEDLSASPLFLKFLGDAARSVCTKLADVEAAAPPETPSLLIHAGAADTLASAPEKIDLNLRALLLRFHGRAAVAGDPALEPWRWLYQSAELLAKSPAGGWRAVCVALIIHPDFYSH